MSQNGLQQFFREWKPLPRHLIFTIICYCLEYGLDHDLDSNACQSDHRLLHVLSGRQYVLLFFHLFLIFLDVLLNIFWIFVRVIFACSMTCIVRAAVLLFFISSWFFCLFFVEYLSSFIWDISVKVILASSMTCIVRAAVLLFFVSSWFFVVFFLNILWIYLGYFCQSDPRLHDMYCHGGCTASIPLLRPP